MIEYTKGELKVSSSNPEYIYVCKDGKNDGLFAQCDVGDYARSREEGYANAKEIVRRWNSHPDLLSVCNDILLALKKIKNTQKIDPFYLDTLIAVLDSAILKQSGCRPPVEGETDNPDPLPEQQSKKEG